MGAGPGRLDGGVEGQQIGLEGDFVDDLDDFGDALARLADLSHGLDHLGHLRIALLGRVASLGRQGVGLGRVLGVEPGLGGHFGHRAADLLQRAGLFGRPLGKALAGVGDLGAARSDALRGEVDPADHAAKAFHHGLQGPSEFVAGPA